MTGLAWILLCCAVQEPTVAELYRPGEQAHWRIEVGEEVIGHHWSVYRGRASLPGASAHYFEARTELRSTTALGEVTQRYSADLWTADSGLPLRFVLEAQIGDSYSRVELDFAGTEAVAVIVQGPSRRELKVPVPEGAYVLANNFISHFELLLGLRPPPDGEASVRQFFSANVLKGVPVTFEPVGKFETETASGRILRDSLGETIELSTRGHVEQLLAGGVVFRRVDERFTPFELTRPERAVASREGLSEVDVSIRHGDVTLAGTLGRRDDLDGPLPAVFFVSGSGPQNRDGFSNGIDTGTHEILDDLVRRGFLVLRVDDRGVGASTGAATGISFDDLVADARACVDFLLEHEGVDHRHVFVIGHSEGGITAPLLAVERPELAGIVLMAAPGRSLIEVIYEQNEAVLRGAGGLDEPALAEAMRQLRREMTRFCSDEPVQPEELDENFRALLPERAWFQSHARQDPVATIRAVRCPVLILQGGLDFQVSPERDAQVLEDALEDAQHPDHVLVLFPPLDHLFKEVPGEVSKGTDYFMDRRVSPAFLATLARWLDEHARH